MHEVFISSNVNKPRFTLDWLKGFKSDIGFWEPFIREISSQCRANADVMGFENPGNSLNFLPRYRNAAYERFFWEDSKKNRDLPYIAGAHSLGAFLLLEHLIDDEKAKHFVDNYDGLFLANPFMGDPWHDIALCKAFSRTWPMRNWPVGISWVEKWKVGVLKEGYEDNPTQIQSDMLHQEATKLLHRIKENGGLSKHLKGFPIAIIAGEKDKACDNAKILELADALGISAVIYPETGHNPLLCSEDAFDDFKHWTTHVVNGKRPKPPTAQPLEPV